MLNEKDKALLDKSLVQIMNDCQRTLVSLRGNDETNLTMDMIVLGRDVNSFIDFPYETPEE